MILTMYRCDDNNISKSGYLRNKFTSRMIAMRIEGCL